MRGIHAMSFVHVSTELEEVPMRMVVALDVHRKQITYKSLGLESGEVKRGRISPAAPRSADEVEQELRGRVVITRFQQIRHAVLHRPARADGGRSQFSSTATAATGRQE